MSKPPHVLVLMCDHHRFDALSCLGNPLARTPNLDRLAARSVRFDQCFNQSPVCAPARHSLATGRYAHTHGVITNSHMPFPNMVTVAHALQPLGYRRFNLGHMHWKDPNVDTGYEPWVPLEIWQDQVPQEVVERYEWERQNITRRTTGGPSPRTREQYSGYHIAQRAIAQIEKAVQNDEPFFSWVAFTEPHPPFYPPKALYEHIDQAGIDLPQQAPPDAPPPHPYIANKQREWAHLTPVEVRQLLAGYYGMVELVDGTIGMVLDTLDRLNIRDDTIVIWTVDHGDQMWEHEMFLKFCMYEASIHVPLLIDVPGNAPGARTELVEHIDLFPTICDLVGAPCPESVQGRSLAPLLGRAPAPGDWRDAVFSQIGKVRMIRTKRWKLNSYDGQPGELYDLQHDPHEFYNRLADPACECIVRDLYDRLQVWQQ